MSVHCGISNYWTVGHISKNTSIWNRSSKTDLFFRSQKSRLRDVTSKVWLGRFGPSVVWGRSVSLSPSFCPHLRSLQGPPTKGLPTFTLSFWRHAYFTFLGIRFFITARFLCGLAAWSALLGVDCCSSLVKSNIACWYVTLGSSVINSKFGLLINFSLRNRWLYT